MTPPKGYVLGQTDRAARRLQLQDSQFDDASEWVLDHLNLRPQDRVVELGCGPGAFSRRVLKRLGEGGVLLGVDSSKGLLDEAQSDLATVRPARFETVQADVAQLGPWLDGADVVVARTVLHHIPMVEFVLGRLRARLRPGTRLGLIEPDFRTPLALLSYLEVTGRPELAPLRVWARAINELYLANRLSPDVGATLAATLAFVGFEGVRSTWYARAFDDRAIENTLMFYDEVPERLIEKGILSAEEIDEQKRLLRLLPSEGLPAAWGIHCVVCQA